MKSCIIHKTVVEILLDWSISGRLAVCIRMTVSQLVRPHRPSCLLGQLNKVCHAGIKSCFMKYISGFWWPPSSVWRDRPKPPEDSFRRHGQRKVSQPQGENPSQWWHWIKPRPTKAVKLNFTKNSIRYETHFPNSEIVILLIFAKKISGKQAGAELCQAKHSLS